MGVWLKVAQSEGLTRLLKDYPGTTANVSDDGGGAVWVDLYQLADDAIVWQGYVHEDGTTGGRV